LIGLAPKGCFISAEAIESEIGQISQTQKAPRELNGRAIRRYRATGQYFWISFAVGRNFLRIVSFGLNSRCMDNVARMRQQLTGLPITTQMLSLNFK
jgi:hypothetical protein